MEAPASPRSQTQAEGEARCTSTSGAYNTVAGEKLRPFGKALGKSKSSVLRLVRGPYALEEDRVRASGLMGDRGWCPRRLSTLSKTRGLYRVLTARVSALQYLTTSCTVHQLSSDTSTSSQPSELGFVETPKPYSPPPYRNINVSTR